MQLPPDVVRSTILLLTTVAIIGANSLSLGPIAPGIAIEMNTSLTSVLTASAAYGIGTAVSAFFLAPGIDRLGARTCLLKACGLLSIAFLMSAVVPGAMWLSIAQFFAGIGAGVALPAAYTCVPAIAPENQQNKVMGLVLTGWTISMVAGVGLAAIIADILHWRAVYLLLFAIAATVFAGILRSRLPSRRSDRASQNQLTALRSPGALLLLSVVACYMIAFYGVYNFVGDHVVVALGFSLSANAWISIGYGTGFGLAAFADPLLDKLQHHSTSSNSLPAIAMTILACLYLLLALSSGSYVTLLICAVIWGLVNHVVLNILLGALNRIDPERRGSILGLYSCVTYLALSIATLGYGQVYEFSTLSFLCLLSALFCFTGAITARGYQLKH